MPTVQNISYLPRTYLIILIIFGMIYSERIYAERIKGQNLQGDAVNSSFEFEAWRSDFGGFTKEKQQFIKSEPVSVRVSLPSIYRVEEASSIYVLAVAGNHIFIKNSQGHWLPFNGQLIAHDSRVLDGSEEMLEIIANLALGAAVDLAFYVAYTTPQGDFIYNSKPFVVSLKEGYNKVLTFGEHGDFDSCNDFQMALNLIQDWEEIRIEQGTYNCKGLTLPKGKDIELGIKISGGWDKSFTTQSDDASLTVFDAGSPILPEFTNTDIRTCLDNGGVRYEAVYCYAEGLEDKRFFTFYDGPLLIENLTFKNAFKTDGGSAIYNSYNETYVKNCAFEYNYGGTLYRVEYIADSVFNDNVSKGEGGAVVGALRVFNSRFSRNASGNGGAVKGVDEIINSTFTENYTIGTFSRGGAVYAADYVIQSTFTDNVSSSAGGAIAYATQVESSRFTGNQANTGGAVFEAQKVYFNRFTGNQAVNQLGGALAKSGEAVNNIFTQNSAAVHGGAVSGIARLYNNLFIENSAPKGGACASDHGVAFVVNNTFVNNVAEESGGAVEYVGASLYNNVFSGNRAAGEESDIHSNGTSSNFILNNNIFQSLSGVANILPNNLFANPVFADAANNNFQLSGSSPGIDQGSNEKNDEMLKQLYYYVNLEVGNRVSLYQLNNTDLNGNSRVIQGVIDIGAYENQGP